MRSRRHLDPLIAQWCGHDKLVGKRRLGERHGEVVDQIVPMALESRVVFKLQPDDQIAGGCASDPGTTLPSQCQIVALRHAGRDVDLDDFIGAASALACAFAARAINYLTSAVTVGTGGDGNKISEKRLGRLADISRAPTGGASNHRPSRRRARSIAGAALLKRAELHLPLGSLGDILQGQPQRYPDVLAGKMVPTPPATPAENRLEPGATEVAHENVERFRKIEWMESSETSRSTPTPTLQPLGSIPVIPFALLRIPQHLVGLGRLFESLLRALRAVVPVGVILHRLAAIGSLDVSL